MAEKVTKQVEAETSITKQVEAETFITKQVEAKKTVTKEPKKPAVEVCEDIPVGYNRSTGGR